MKNKDLQLALNKDLQELDIALEGLKLSYKKCSDIGIKDIYSFEEQESFDSLSSKFARCSDLFTQKIFKTIFLLLRENPKSFIDRVNLAEKLEMIPSGEELLNIRDLRNEIVHEYVFEELKEIYSSTLLKCPVLITAIAQSKSYIEQMNLKNI